MLSASRSETPELPLFAGVRPLSQRLPHLDAVQCQEHFVVLAGELAVHEESKVDGVELPL